MTARWGDTRGEGVTLILMGVMIMGGIVMWLSTGDFHMMPMHGSGHRHDKAGAASSTHDPHGNAHDPAVDQRNADQERLIEAEPPLDNP